jgi:indolepyruvate ferredoxin oxidoreductase, alpha subunit
MKASVEILMGNHSMARGFVEAGVQLAAAYPGTPSSEILPGIVAFKRREGAAVHTEWSVNERCAMEVAFGAALSGKRAVCMMKQVGLNVAFPPLLKGYGKTLKGGLVIVSCDDPGPQSSQTEQDTRLLASLYGIPVFDPASPKEAGDVAYYAMHYSVEHHTPVIIRPTHRVSHAREAVELMLPGTRKVILDEGIRLDGGRGLGIIASGMSSSIAMDVIGELGLEDSVSLFKVVKIFPLGREVTDFAQSVDKVLVIEETDSVLEALIGDKGRVLGRRNSYVPAQGELTYDVMRDMIQRVAEETDLAHRRFSSDPAIDNTVKAVSVPPRPPKLCAGCSHRASFFAMRQAYPEAIFPGDIGCYTLGISIGAVDTCLDMGGGVNLAAGFYDTFNQDGRLMPILASVGDSTFFHACLSPLYDAVKHNKKFVLVIMDNGVTAMTGMQPTPQSGITVDGTQGGSLLIENVVKGFGVGFLKILDPYDVQRMLETIKEAYGYLERDGRGPAVIIARRKCTLQVKGEELFQEVCLEEECVGCKRCFERFDCPAVSFDKKKRRVTIDEGLCIKCGVCLTVCRMIRPKGKVGKKPSEHGI